MMQEFHVEFPVVGGVLIAWGPAVCPGPRIIKPVGFLFIGDHRQARKVKKYKPLKQLSLWE